MRQSDKMADQCARQDNGRTEQQIVLLRANGEQNQNHDVKKHDAVIKLPRTDFVVVTRAEEMDDASDAQAN
jgi:hypothetical protein